MHTRPATPFLFFGSASNNANNKPTRLALMIASAALIPGLAIAQQETAAEKSVTQLNVLNVVGVRDNRISSGATNLPLAIKDTPQSISIVDQDTYEDFSATGSNEALRLSTGVNVEQYETNRAAFNARGFEVQLTQIDGLGMTNDYGTVVGQLDTFLFEKIELIRGANGLLTGVGNASGTINYVRKRPTNEDGGKLVLSGGSHRFLRAAADYNKVLSEQGDWAARIVFAHEDKGSHLRALHNRRTSLYGVLDGQVGENGILTLGLTVQANDQDSPMWGSLTLNYPDGSQAEFNRSASTSQDWTYWNTKSYHGFIEYTQQLNADWQAKLAYNYRFGEDDTRLFYAYSPVKTLQPDNTGLFGWPYSANTEVENHLLDVSISGNFMAFGQTHDLIAGMSASWQDTEVGVYHYDTSKYQFLPLPAFPYAGNVYPQPQWYDKQPNREGEKHLTRLYAATRLNVTDRFTTILGVNGIRLEREGSSRYGNVSTATDFPDTKEISPYLGFTYDLTDNLLGYVSYSDIFQNQDQSDFAGNYLDPMKGVNWEAGLKAEWLDNRLLTTLAVFGAKQKGIATYAGKNDQGVSYYVPEDVESKGVELEAVGRISERTQLAFGVTHLELTGPEGEDMYEWIPQTTLNLRLTTRPAIIPGLKLGLASRWQSDTQGDNARQGAYLVANGFAAYELSEAATLKLNINNLFNKKYAEGLAYGAIYGAPRSGLLTFEYRL